MLAKGIRSMDIKEVMAIMAMSHDENHVGSGGTPPPGGWGKGTVLVEPGQRKSTNNDFQIHPQTRLELMQQLHRNMMRRRKIPMRGLFGGGEDR